MITQTAVYTFKPFCFLFEPFIDSKKCVLLQNSQLITSIFETIIFEHCVLKNPHINPSITHRILSTSKNNQFRHKISPTTCYLLNLLVWEEKQLNSIVSIFAFHFCHKTFCHRRSSFVLPPSHKFYILHWQQACRSTFLFKQLNLFIVEKWFDKIKPNKTNTVEIHPLANSTSQFQNNRAIQTKIF